MKTKQLLTFALICITFTFIQNTFAQDYTQWHLPKGAKARLGKGRISDIQFSPDGKQLAVATNFGSTWIYDTHNWKEQDLLWGDRGRVNCVAFSPNDNLLAIAFTDVRLWNAKDRQYIHILTGSNSEVKCLEFSPDGKILAGGTYSGSIYLWNVSNGKLMQRITTNNSYKGVLSISFTPNGKTLASGGYDKIVRLYDVATGQHIRKFTEHTDHVTGVAFLSDGQTLASCSHDSTIRIWNVSTGKLMKTLKDASEPYSNPHRINDIAISPDGKTLVSASYSGDLWDIDTGEHIRQLIDETGYVYRGLTEHATFSPDGKMLAAKHNGNIYLWDMTIKNVNIRFKRNRTDGSFYLQDTSKNYQKHVKHIITGHSNIVRGVDFSKNDQTLATCHNNGIIDIWNAKKHNHIRSLNDKSSVAVPSVTSVKFSPDGKELVSGTRVSPLHPPAQPINIWHVKSGKKYGELIGHKQGIISVAISPDGRTIASGSADSTIRLWNAKSGRNYLTLEGHIGAVNSVSFSPDGQKVASGSNDHTVRLWNVKSGHLIKTFEGHTEEVNSITYSPDGQKIASASYDNKIHLWDVLSGTIKQTLIGHRRGLHCVTFSPDGKIIASGGYETLCLWNAQTGELLRTLSDKMESTMDLKASVLVMMGKHLQVEIMMERRFYGILTRF